MANILEQPEQFKAELKDKWLDYYEGSRSWLQHYMDTNKGWYDLVNYDQEELENLGVDEDYRPRRPECYFILGVISVLDPSVRGLFTFIGYSNANSEEMVKALGLDFDPEIELKKRCLRLASQSQQQQQPDIENKYLEQIREEIKT